jgi:hypothetical protein
MLETTKEHFKGIVLEKVQDHLAERIVSLATGTVGIDHTKIMFNEYLKVIERLQEEL